MFSVYRTRARNVKIFEREQLYQPPIHSLSANHFSQIRAKYCSRLVFVYGKNAA